MISDHLGKAAASVLYDDVDAGYHKYVPESQCGAVKGKSCDFASHLLRTLLDCTKARSLTIAILFVDLVKAFDRLLREVVIGWPQTGTQGGGVKYVVELGLLHRTQPSSQTRLTRMASSQTANLFAVFIERMHLQAFPPLLQDM